MCVKRAAPHVTGSPVEILGSGTRTPLQCRSHVARRPVYLSSAATAWERANSIPAPIHGTTPASESNLEVKQQQEDGTC